MTCGNIREIEMTSKKHRHERLSAGGSRSTTIHPHPQIMFPDIHTVGAYP